jgi:hypothetical protein
MRPAPVRLVNRSNRGLTSLTRREQVNACLSSG